MQVSARVEVRTWYSGGKYLGKNAPWILGNLEDAEPGHVEQEIRNREMMLKNVPADTGGEIQHGPVRTGDWGEYRIVTVVA